MFEDYMCILDDDKKPVNIKGHMDISKNIVVIIKNHYIVCSY